MGPTKAVVKGNAIYDARTGKLIQSDLGSTDAVQDYARHHYMVLPETDKAGRPWELNGEPVFCFRGSRYETLNEHQPHLARCPDCGGMGLRIDEVTVERDCIRCVTCGHEFDARLEMMES
jgi:hypothetical protein